MEEGTKVHVGLRKFKEDLVKRPGLLELLPTRQHPDNQSYAGCVTIKITSGVDKIHDLRTYNASNACMQRSSAGS